MTSGHPLTEDSFIIPQWGGVVFSSMDKSFNKNTERFVFSRENRFYLH
jgi:hypothetical protein